MITEVMTSVGKRIHVLSESDLDVDASGERLRAFCPIHGSDHQRSLSIDASTGWGWCHCCHSTVFVEEYDASIAATLKRSEHRGQRLRGLPDRPVRRCPSRSHPPPTHLPAAQTAWQRDEVAALEAVWPLMREELASERVAAYLDERGIAPDLAWGSNLGYLSLSVWEDALVSDAQHDLLSRWIGRIIFPLGSPAGRGYIGRTIVCWDPGMDEYEHKSMLEAENIKRWIKTNPAGWYGLHPSRYAPTVILVEGGFDRLSLIAAGLPPQAIVALVGTAAKIEWIVRFAPQVRRLVLALDGDEGGTSAMERLAGAFRDADLSVECCPPPVDGWGKDWNERYRKCGEGGIAPLIHVVTRCQF